MRITAHPKPRRKKNKISALLFLTLVSLALIVWLDYATRPAIESIIAYQVRVFATKLVNEAMIDEMDREDISYDKLVKLTRNNAGDVTSIEADMAQINRIKSGMGKKIIGRLESGSAHEIFIPLGTVIGNQLTSGRGPDIGIKVTPTGYVQSEIFNRFSSAGINQTQHQIMLSVNVQMIAVLPGYRVKTETETNFCIAETIIVGDIPDGYAAIGGFATTFSPVAPNIAAAASN